MKQVQNFSIVRLTDSKTGADRLRSIKNDPEPGYFESCFARDDTLEIFVIVSGGVDAGYCLLNYAPKYRPFAVQNIPEIQDLNVVSTQRRQGLGQALVQNCEDVARARGFVEIGIGVGLHKDYAAAQRLYVKGGYVPDGQGAVYDRIPVVPHEMRAVDDHLNLMMTKRL